MDSSVNFSDMIEQLNCPAFVAENGRVRYMNSAAEQRQICVDASISEYISQGAEEYANFSSGKLCLTLTVCGTNYNASVTCLNGAHVFYLDSDYQEPELRAFALAAQHLREPLANAMTCANYLLPSECSKDVQNQLARLNKNLYQLHRAICNMADAAHYQNPRLSRIEYREIGSIFSEIMEKAAQLISKGTHTLTYKNLTKSVGSMVDAEKLERALLNMISNAVKFAPKGSEINASVRVVGKKIYFSVENINDMPVTGKAANIFAHYLREPGIEHPETGIGLGMAIVRKAAAVHGGTLLMEQLDTGLRFTMAINIQPLKSARLRSNVQFPVDYAGGYDHALTELSDILSHELYK